MESCMARQRRGSTIYFNELATLQINLQSPATIFHLAQTANIVLIRSFDPQTHQRT
jgi:hypothetical protein